MTLHSGPLAIAPCVNAQSSNSARVVFIWLPLRATLPAACSQSKQAASQEVTGPISPTPIAQHAAKLFRRYFFLPEPKLGCHPAVFWLGAAAMVLIFSF